MPSNFWITLEVPATSENDARTYAWLLYTKAIYGRGLDCRIVDVQPKPPQGSTVIGDFNDD